MTFGSLFAGIGGMDLGLERAGMTCKWQVEIDDYARRVLAKHWPDVRRHGDVRTFPPAGEWGVDLIAGGFPCQDISNAGKQSGIDGERSGLWREYARIVRVLRPRFVLMENVSALLGRGLGRILGDLAACGYDAEWDCIPACAVGALHIRDRLFVLAYPEHGRVQKRRRVTDAGKARRKPRRIGQDGAQGLPLQETKMASVGVGVGVGLEGIFQTGTKEGTAFRDCGRWPPEPDVGRVADGVPFGLELLGGRLNGGEIDNQKADTKTCFLGWQVLRMLWEQRELATASPHILGNRLRDIVPSLPCNGGLARWVASAETDKELHYLWERFYALPFQEARDLQQALFERAWASERKQTMVSKSQRVHRIRGLGNAVVPQVAEWIGRRIMESQ